MSIFKTWAHKYFESGIPVIPLNGKVPIVSNWTVWSKRQQTLEEVDALVEKYPNANIGSVLGLWASAIDIDTNDIRVLSAVPYSPFRRRGKKGCVYLFAKSSIDNVGASVYPVEYLNHGRQIVLPPSIHPETGEAYEWVGEESFDGNFSSLPVITREHIETLIGVCKAHNITTSVGSHRSVKSGDHVADLTDVGRNNRLTSVAYAMACDQVEESEAVERLLEFDKREHDVPWFSDKTEPHRGRDPRKTATLMFQRAVKSAVKNNHVRTVTYVQELDLSGLLKEPQKEEEKDVKYPVPRGLMLLFQSYCQAMSNGAQDALGLGGSITLMSGICSNRFRSKSDNFDIWPNTFVINLAYSGFGKEVPQRAIEDILVDTNIIGASSYKSGSSIVMGLPEQQERIDIIDECSGFLKTMSSKEDYKSEIVEILSSLYSKSSSRYLGITTRTDGARFGACWNPCVNILGSTTPAGFRESVTKDMAAKGLMPRFLVFYQREIGDYKKQSDDASKIFKEIKRIVRTLFAVEKQRYEEDEVIEDLLADSDRSIRYAPMLIPMTESAQSLLGDIREEYFNEGRFDPEGFESAFKNRFAQHVGKLALLDAVSMGIPEITVDNVDWAHNVVKAQWERSRGLYELANASNDYERAGLKFMQVLHEKGREYGGLVPKNVIWRAFSNIKAYELAQLESHLITSGLIEKVVERSGKPGPAATFFRIVK